jgi:hypothetical protein
LGNRQGRFGRLREIAARVLVEPEPQPRRPDPLFALPGRAEVLANVILDPDAQPRLEWLATANRDPGGSSQIFPSAARPADGGEQIEVRLRSHRIEAGRGHGARQPGSQRRRLDAAYLPAASPAQTGPARWPLT